MASTTLHAAYAKHLLRHALVKKRNIVLDRKDDFLPPAQPEKLLAPAEDPDMNMPICIVGAGPTGLSAAIMLWYLGFTNVTLLEASKRTGGRAYTHHFPPDSTCPHNYYDAGAMRIPEIATQQSTLNMITYLNKNGENVPLADYIFNTGKEPSWYEWPEDDSYFDDYMTTLLYTQGFPGIPQPKTVTKPVQSKSFDKAFSDFISSSDHPDRWSTRAWLMNGPAGNAPNPGWLYERTEKAETFDTSTGLFDQAFMETICDWYDFAQAKITKAKWHRVEGGMSVLTDALRDHAIKNGTNIYTTAPVTAVKANPNTITVTYADTAQPYSQAVKGSPPTEYAAVFNTTTFGSLRRMDIQGLNLSPDNLCGIRALSYDRATKVAIKFNTAWWRRSIPVGGVSNTDLPIGNVVYPSWDDGNTCPYTIIVSYSWAQDAARMAALMGANDQDSTDPNEPIIQLCFQNLAKLWSNSPSAQQLQEMYLAHHAFAWSHDPYSLGAYALFGPGQFEFMYPQFTKPLCQNMFSICGEAVSAHHAWISGAFDSAYNAVYTWCAANRYIALANKLKFSVFGNGPGENTAELDDDLLVWQLRLDVLEQKADS